MSNYGRGGYGRPYGADMQAPPPPPGPWDQSILAPGAATASLNPPNNMERLQNPMWAWTRYQCFYPEPLTPEGPGITYQIRRRVLQFRNLVLDTETTLPIRFDVPGPIWQLTGAARDSTGAAFPVGLNSLDTFSIRFTTSNGEKLDEAEGFGSAMLGTGSQPCFLGRETWQFDNGSVLLCFVTALRTNVDVDVVAWHREVRGPTNLARS